MPSYRYCFLDSADRVAEFHVIASETDDEAQTHADRLLAACDYPSIEVWDHSRMVCRVRKADGPAPWENINMFRCRHCGGTSYRLLAGADGKPAAECLNCGRASSFDRSMAPEPPKLPDSK
jgi:hypothetical protein